MAYYSYDNSRRSRAERFDQYDRGPNSYDRSPRAQDRGYDRSERDFFDRASDEVKSWFGDDRAEYRREMDERRDERRERMDERWDRSPRYSEEGYRRPYTGRYTSRSSFTQPYDRSQPETGFSDYDRHGGAFTSERWSIGPNGQIRPQSTRDDDYSNWRNREMSSLDRDYDEFRRERQERFNDEFGQWRSDRMTKRQTLGQVTEHMEVVGNDGEFVGKVDKVRGDNVILTKSDSWDEKHHSVPCSLIDGIEDGKLKLTKSCEDAKKHLENSTHERFLFEERREEMEQPHMLNRSFSGTY